MKKLLPIILLVGLVIWVLFQISTKTSNPVETPPPSNDTTEILTLCSLSTNTNEYKNEDAGISFLYPHTATIDREYVDDVSQKTGVLNASGKKFVGQMTLDTLVTITFGGVTKDFSYPRGASITDFSGYQHDTGLYGTIFSTDPTSDDIGKALLIKNTTIEMFLDSGSIAVYLNTPNTDFTGLVFVLSPNNSSTSTLTEEEITTFKDIVSSVCFL